MFVAPSQVIPIWPWMLTPLTCRVVGAIFCLGERRPCCAGGFQMDHTPAAASGGGADGHTHPGRGRASEKPSSTPAGPFTWVLLGGFVAILLGSSFLWYTMEIRARP